MLSVTKDFKFFIYQYLCQVFLEFYETATENIENRNGEYAEETSTRQKSR